MPEESTAFHEAGHALAAWILGQPIALISLDSEDLEDTHAEACVYSFHASHDSQYPKHKKTYSFSSPYYDNVVVFLAGRRASEIAFKTGYCSDEYFLEGDDADNYEAEESAKLFVASDDNDGPTSLSEVMNLARQDVSILLDDYWHAVVALALELEEEREISGTRARDIISAALGEV